jgi:peptidoglycan/LPS O-acetylase OafA/YrhL
MSTVTESKGTIVKDKTQVNELHPKYRPDIDGLRAVAVLLVVIYHAFPGRIPGGFIGVDIFFVISGFLISSIIFSNLERGSFSIADFYNRRIRRIFPALLIVMGCSLTFGWATLFADEYAQLAKHVAGGAAFVSNFLLYHESGYFDNTSATKPMLHLWSLAIEEQFYIFWPLLLAFVWKRKWSFLRITAVIAVLSFAANIYLIQKNPVAAFYWPISRFWELMIGGLLAYTALHKPALIRRGKNLQSTAGFILLFAGAVLINDEQPFPGWWALLPTVASFFIISAGPEGWFNKYVLSTRIFVWFGLISYPFYLWHWPLFSFIRIIDGSRGGRILRVAAVVAAIALAWLTYQFVEKPIRQKGSYRTVLALATAMILMAAVGLCIVRFHGFEGRAAIRNSTFNAEVAQQFSGPIWQYTSDDSCLRRFPLKGSQDFEWWFCMLEGDQPPTFILLGNSYANELYPGLVSRPELAKQVFLSVGDCDPGEGSHDVGKNNPCYGDGAALQEKFIDKIIVENGTIRYAIIDGLISSDRAIYYPDAAYIHRLKERIDFLESHGIQVIIFYPHLMVDLDLRECFGRALFPAKQNCILPLNVREDINAHFKPLVDGIHASNPNVLFFDQNDLFCNDRNCSLIQDGLPLYRDEYHHISEFGSIRVAENFVAFLRQNLPQALQ